MQVYCFREERAPPRRLKTNRNSREMHKPVPAVYREYRKNGVKRKRTKEKKETKTWKVGKKVGRIRREAVR